jgi:hypothetical protein
MVTCSCSTPGMSETRSSVVLYPAHAPLSAKTILNDFQEALFYQ